VTEHCGRRKQEEHNASEHHYGSVGRSIFHDGCLAFGVIPLPPVRRAKLHWRNCSCLDPAAKNATARERKRMGFPVDFDHGQLQVAVKWCSCDFSAKS
jgi:hypothetical protein